MKLDDGIIGKKVIQVRSNLEKFFYEFWRSIPGSCTKRLLHFNCLGRKFGQQVWNMMKDLLQCFFTEKINMHRKIKEMHEPLHSGQPCLPSDTKWAEHLNGFGPASSSFSSSSSSSTNCSNMLVCSITGSSINVCTLCNVVYFDSHPCYVVPGCK